MGALAVIAVPALGIAAAGSALALGIGVVAGGIVAGAVGSGLNAAMTDGGCVPCALAAGALGGALGSLPFLLALPGMALAGAGVLMAAGFQGLGALGGALGYLGEWAASQATPQPLRWSVEALLLSTAIGAGTAGVGRLLGPKIANYRALQAARQGKPRPKGPYDVPQELDINSDGVYGYVPRKGSGLNDLPVDYTNRTSVAKARPVRQRYREDLRKKRDYARQLERSGASDEDIARALNEKRNADRMSTYSDRDQPKIRARNMRDYGREEGPSYDMLRSGTSEGTKQFNAPKTDREIIARAEARNPGGDAPRR